MNEQPITPATQIYIEPSDRLMGFTCNYCLWNEERNYMGGLSYPAVVEIAFEQVFEHFNKRHQSVVTFEIDVTDIDVTLETLDYL